MRKFFAILLASLLLCTLLTACTDGESEDETAKAIVGGDDDTAEEYVVDGGEGDQSDEKYGLGGVPLT